MSFSTKLVPGSMIGSVPQHTRILKFYVAHFPTLHSKTNSTFDADIRLTSRPLAWTTCTCDFVIEILVPQQNIPP